MNKTLLIGRLTQTPTLRFTDQSGKAVTNFTLAVPRRFKNDRGEKVTDFIKCVLWNKQAERFVDWVKKGNRVSISGELQSRSYKDKNNQTQNIVEINVEEFELLEKKEVTSQPPLPEEPPFGEPPYDY